MAIRAGQPSPPGASDAKRANPPASARLHVCTLLQSLTTKLVLAFVLTSVAGVVLAAVFIRQFVTRQFDDYVLEQQRTYFIEQVRTYYDTHGTLTGIAAAFPRQAIFISARAVPDSVRATALAEGAPFPSSGFAVSAPVFTSPMPVTADLTTRPSASMTTATLTSIAAPAAFAQWQFGLVDATGVVVLPFDNHRISETLQPADYARGMPISINDDNNVRIGTIITAGPAAFRRTAEEGYLRRTDFALLVAAAVMVGVALVFGIVLARLITRPLRELTTAAGKIASGDLEQVVPVRSSDELGVLANQFNHMSADLVRANQLRQQMTADIAHDLRTPLTVISGYMEALRDQVLKPTPERFAMMHDEIQFLRHLVEDLHTLNVADAGELHLERQRVSPMVLLNRVADAYQDAAEKQGVALQVRGDWNRGDWNRGDWNRGDMNPGDEDRHDLYRRNGHQMTALPTVCVDLEHTIRAISNLVSNALRYTPAGGKITLVATEEPLLDHEVVLLKVADTGSGIAPEHLANIFERSYRADASRQQEGGETGLGLAIVKSIVEAHGGRVSVESLLGHGTTFTIVLPVG